MRVAVVQDHHEILCDRKRYGKPHFFSLAKLGKHLSDDQRAPGDLQNRKQIPDICCDSIWDQPEWEECDEEEGRVPIIHHSTDGEVRRVQIGSSLNERTARRIVNRKIDEIANDKETENSYGNDAYQHQRNSA